MIIGEDSNYQLKRIEGLVISDNSSASDKCLCNEKCPQPTIMMIVALMKCLNKDVLVYCLLSSYALRNGHI